jgi:hypothetical protein
MPYFFNGELLISPAVATAVVDSAMANTNQGLGNVLLLLGKSTLGAPGVAVSFDDPTDAVAYFGSGDLCDAMYRAFAPSNDTDGPQTVIGIRVGAPTQSTLTLLDSSAAPSIVLTSNIYGVPANQIKIQIENGSTTGRMITVQLGTTATYFQDNIANSPFSIQYTGSQASATMVINNATGVLILDAPGGTVLSTLTLTNYPTIQTLVDAINTVAGFSATVTPGCGSQPTVGGLDSLATTDVKTAVYAVQAEAYAILTFLNSAGEGLVSAVLSGGAQKPPANIPFTYLAGGSYPSVLTQDWANAFALAQTVDCQWVVPLNGTAAIASMADAHVQFMSNQARKERRAICGTILGTTDAQAIAAALALNSDRTSLVHLGVYDFQPAQSGLTLFQPYITAAIIGAMFSAVSPGIPLTGKSLAIQGVERMLQNPVETDPLITGGVLCIEQTSTGYEVVKSISTWLTNDNFNRVEQSCGAAVDFTARTVRLALKKYVGAAGSPITLGAALADTDTALGILSKPVPSGPGVLVGDAASPPFKNISGTLTGDVLAISFQASPVIPINYVPITIFIVPYSGTASI